ncbi:phosphoribosylamine--glycine ligase [Desulfonispora thiosulfatigenes DSM 11270]|uniref:Phosphoribosylamine--glycine ligase n=1 Tax=Desulfonispora thiosulfatigenes DSM 11270 TaxID=656914 RepID=A0A1W1VEK3_DESTI|nr:phosphoribosylamine--glycine ligase [Desulfonispora thiosulfatigenes]SMB91643.1 phosphoribosylamine--glycine ligase [Desulfonispora thiosulfatigenes DSM 11270]
MQVLIIGSGGREHALAWKISQSPKVSQIYCAPGNAGISEYATCIEIKDNNLDELLSFAKEKQIDLTIVGPEIPLSLGIVDLFNDNGLKIFGPSKLAAEIEGSKAFSKDLMKKYNIPTAEYEIFTEVEPAKDYLQDIGIPCVVKADGLAAGKGVMVCFTEEEALKAIYEILLDQKFGDAGARLVIEEYLEGQEVSMLAFSDGKTIVPMVSAQDHKQVFDNDKGPNTGGMGAYSPAPIYTDEIHDFVVTEVLEKTIKAMEIEGRNYQGILYAGLMLTPKGPKVLEYNARFGDPETQVVLPRLETDLIVIIEAILENTLDKITIKWSQEAAVCVVMASGGYPGDYEKDKVITGLEKVSEPTRIFHAGTATKNGQIVTNGGRVLGVTALGKTIQEAINNAYKGVEKINFADVHYRKDIGAKAVKG